MASARPKGTPFLLVVPLLCGLPFEASRTRGEEPPAAGFGSEGFNILFISLTNVRADHLGAYGYSRDTSPAIDALAKRSLVFENTFSPASWTLPVAVSLLTSQYPFTHGLMNRQNQERLPPSEVTLIDVLKKSGYFTAAFVGDRDYSPAFGHTSRFDEVHDHVQEENSADWKMYGVLEKTVPRAISWLRGNREKRFFLLVQGYDAHCPFAIPRKNDMFDPDYKGEIDFTKCYWTFRRTLPIKIESQKAGEKDSAKEAYLLKTKPDESSDEVDILFYPEDLRHMVALYDGEIRNADALVGSLLKEVAGLGLDRKTIIVIFSEHGDMFGKHGRFMRGGPLRGTFYDDVLRVPLIIHHPRLEPRRIDGLVEVIDITPTLLDFVGIDRPAAFRGKTLRPLILDGAPVHEHVFAGSAYTPQKRSVFFRHDSIITGVRTKEWKLILEKVFQERGKTSQELVELFDLEKDPEELRNVAAERPELCRELRERISAWLKEIDAGPIALELSR